jgi:adiponectin receptor
LSLIVYDRLISASVGSVVYYAFQDQPDLQTAFLSLCFVSGLLGSIFPFMDWFNDRRYKSWRIAFFLGLAFTGLAPLCTLSCMFSVRAAYMFMVPVIPSLLWYLAGLFFYASHFPERWLAARWAHRLDWFGGGSHAIWHACVVLAIWSWQAGMAVLKAGVPL